MENLMMTEKEDFTAEDVITAKDAIEYAKLLLTMVIVSGFGVDGSIDAIIHASNKASFKAVKVK